MWQKKRTRHPLPYCMIIGKHIILIIRCDSSISMLIHKCNIVFQALQPISLMKRKILFGFRLRVRVRCIYNIVLYLANGPCSAFLSCERPKERTKNADKNTHSYADETDDVSATPHTHTHYSCTRYFGQWRWWWWWS